MFLCQADRDAAGQGESANVGYIFEKTYAEVQAAHKKTDGFQESFGHREDEIPTL